MQRNYQKEPRYDSVYVKKDLPKIKDGHMQEIEVSTSQYLRTG